ncbi:MAG: hypothetical protein IJW59_05280 [Clostridia bacterium]|nr:hypothetical protein [Clostridia bacterium]
MNLICGALKNLWYEFYNNCVKNLDDKTKMIVGISCLVVSMFVFVLCTKGGNKAEMVNSWFLFWVSLIVFVIGIYYMAFA